MHNTFICLIVHLSTDVFTNKDLDMKEIYIYIAIEDFTSTLLGWDLLKSVFAYDIQGESVLNFKTGGQSTDPSACTKGQPIYLTNDLLKAISVFENPNGRKSGGVGSPLDQFEIRNLLSLDAPIIANFQISLTNIRLYLTISAFIALFLNLLATNYNKVIANS